MEIWFVLTSTLCIAFLLNALLSFKSKPARNLPPGPPSIPIITTIQWLRISRTDLEETIRNFTSKFGPIITLPVGSSPAIFISSRSLAHEALIHKGAIFADRPRPVPTAKIFGSDQHNISSAGYGPKWRTLRRNLTSEILHPSRAKEFSNARKWTLDILLNRLVANEGSDVQAAIKAIDHFRFGMFCLLVSMCFGEKLDESKVREVEVIQFTLLTSLGRFRILDRWPRLTWVLLRSRWNELYNLKKKQKEVLIPLIRKRQQLQQGDINKNDDSKLAVCYVDTLLNLELSEVNDTKRKLNEEQIVAACSEFLNAGTDTTSTALEWIMANLVKYPDVQAKLLQEIKGVNGEKAEEIEENTLSKMYYLKAVVLEGLRRHPPGHFVLHHAVTQEVELGGYRIPTDAMINFTVADMGRDPEVWDDPMKFCPERFMSAGKEEFDITGSHEIKMMPFGAGRRICPGYGLAMLHLEYYVANLVSKFEWKAADGYEVDVLSEKQEFTTVMKHSLHVGLSRRNNN